MYLNCHSYFSLRYGTLKPQKLVQEALTRGIKYLVLTDINNTSAHLDFYNECIKAGIKPIVGIEFRNENYQFLYTAIAKNQKGLYELNRFFTDHSLASKPFPELAPSFRNAFVIYRPGPTIPAQLQDNEFIGIAPNEITKMYSSPWKKKLQKLVAFCPITFARKEDYKKHLLLRAIDQNTLLSKLDYKNVAHSSEHFFSEKELIYLYSSYPELLSNAKNLIDQCSISFDKKEVKNKKISVKGRSKEEDFQELVNLANSGFNSRYDNNDTKAKERLKSELEVIRAHDFVCYFLITYYMISYAKEKGFHHVGRGSGANSIVSFCLGITDVDPMTLDLYFERFINNHRSSPPDFDIDFCWNERDEIYDYLFRTHDDHVKNEYHVGLLATYATFQYNSLVRELGKAFGLPKKDIDFILENPREKDKFHPLADEILELCTYLQDFPNHLGIHAGGVIITEEPINNFTALQLMPKGYPIVQFDMHVAEENSFFKYDILSQRGLGHIKDTVALVKQNHNVLLDIHNVKEFYKDPNINYGLSKGRTVGCFYIESPAMRGLITKLQCKDYLTLVAASSIIRPGVAHSGMMREYIFRFHNPQSVKYPHPIFEELLKETFGIMVYQEDVIKIAHYFGGLRLDEADILRRTMSGKHRNQQQLLEAKQKFFNNCKANGCKEEVVKEVWRQIESFSGYSFCKAHSASYAVESYQSLYLKTYYPLEFIVGVINNFGGFYRTEIYVHEARMCGATIEAPCVNNSLYLTSIQKKTIYLGFIHLKSLEQGMAQKIISEREQKGPYRNLEDFIRRTNIGKEQLSILIRIGALRFTGKSKHDLLWIKNGYLHAPKFVKNTVLLFQKMEDYTMPTLEVDEMEEAYEQLELLGFPLKSPFELLKTKFTGNKASDLTQLIGTDIKMIGYFVTRKDVKTVNDKLMNFGTWIDRDGVFFDTTHFPKSLTEYPFTGTGCYLIKGKVVEDFGFPTIEVEKMARLEWRAVK